jgi:hypothetical protein
MSGDEWSSMSAIARITDDRDQKAGVDQRKESDEKRKEKEEMIEDT